MYWQSGHGANLQFYSIDLLTGARTLVNDPLDPAAVVAYTDSSQAAANAPYVAEVSPIPGSSGNDPASSIHALIVDGSRSVNTNSVAVFLNGTISQAAIAGMQSRTIVSYLPSSWAQDDNVAELVYQDSGGVWHTNAWLFNIELADDGETVVMGQWDFEHGDLRATIGQDLEYLDSAFDGPDGSAVDRTQFGTTRHSESRTSTARSRA
jgi:hypothetical protein